MAASRSAGIATYSRDSSTGLDYAINRYYGSNLARFLSPDPFGGSAKPSDPGSWNRYAYVGGDPINHNDAQGLFPCLVGYGERQEITDCQIEEIKVGSDFDSSSKQEEIRQRQLERMQKRVQDAIRASISSLLKNQKCWDLLTGGLSVGDIDPVALLHDPERVSFEIGDVLNDNPGTVISATATVSTLKPVDIGNGATQLQNASVLVTINSLAGSFTGRSASDQRTTVLHELGHAIYDLYGPGGKNILSADYAIKPDARDVKMSETNTNKIKEVCK